MVEDITASMAANAPAPEKGESAPRDLLREIEFTPILSEPNQPSASPPKSTTTLLKSSGIKDTDYATAGEVRGKKRW
jgi:hypothetical protein